MLIESFAPEEFLRLNSCVSFRENLISGFHSVSGFHSDAILCDFVCKLLNNCGTFIETGTYYGITASYVSKNCPGAKIFSCESDKKHFDIATEQCQGTENVKIQHATSWDFLSKIDQLVPKDETPVFWLDAHSYAENETTFLYEMELIKKTYERYVILIDDLKNPYVPNASAQIHDIAIINHLNSLGARWPKYDKTYKFRNGTLNIDLAIDCSSWCMITTETINCRLFDEWMLA